MRKSASLLLVLGATVLSVQAADKSHWVATWGASPAPQLSDEAQMRSAKLVFENQTLREIVHTSIAGNTVRVRLSNAFGKDTAEIAGAHIALRSSASKLASGSDRVLTFGGRNSVAIPPNALVLSDPVQLDLPPSADVAISLFLAKKTLGAGVHYSALQTSYIGSGDMTSAESIEGETTIASWAFVTAVEVQAPEKTGAIVAFGDSITDGARSTVDANRRWPNILASRLQARKGAPIGVVDAGIGGNRILHDAATNVRFGVSALARFDRDVVAQAGVRYVIILEGINDLGHAGQSAPASETVSADDLIAGMKQMIERAHEHGIKVFGATLTPFEGTTIAGYFTPEKEVQRKKLNDFIRNGHSFDGVVDFEKAIRDPKNPDRMLPEFDGGDRLHPGDGGYKAMGEAIDLNLFK